MLGRGHLCFFSIAREFVPKTTFIAVMIEGVLRKINVIKLYIFEIVMVFWIFSRVGAENATPKLNGCNINSVCAT